MRVLWVCTPLLPLGGGFEHLRAWLRHIDRDRFKVTIAFATPSDVVEVAARLATPGVDLRPLPALRSAGQLFIPAIRALRSLIEEIRPDITHSVFIQADIVTAFAAMGTGVPQLSSVFGYLFRSNAGPGKAALYRLGYGLARRRYARVTAISDATATELREEFAVDPGKIVLLRSGVDFTQLDPEPPSLEDRSPSGAVVAIAAQLIPEKQADLFVKAVAIAARRRSDLRAIVAGDGPERSSVEALARDLGLADRISFLGEIDGVPRLLRSVDVVVCAARPGFDGVPRVVLEGMASGAVVVTTKVGGVAEVLRDGIDGIVLDRPGPEALANALVEILADPERRRRYRTSALERVRLFDARREVRELELLYVSLAAASPAR